VIQLSNDYNAKKAIKDAEDFKKANNGKEDPSLKSAAASERAKLMNEYRAANVNPPQWLSNG
jgi:hypothetical protein